MKSDCESCRLLSDEVALVKAQMARLRAKVLHEATTAPMGAVTRMRLRKAVTSP